MLLVPFIERSCHRLGPEIMAVVNNAAGRVQIGVETVPGSTIRWTDLSFEEFHILAQLMGYQKPAKKTITRRKTK